MLSGYKKVIAATLAALMALSSATPVWANESQPDSEILLTENQEEETNEEEKENLENDEEVINDEENNVEVAGDTGDVGESGGQIPDDDPELIPAVDTLDEATYPLSGIEDVMYDGTPKTLEITLQNYEGNVMEEGKDYTVEYRDNTEPGEATVVLTGIGDYDGEIVKTFRILHNIGMECTIDEIDDVTYNKKAQEPAVIVRSGKTKLVKGKDYTVSCENNTDAGKATVIVSGIGDYAGTLEAKFRIQKAKNKISAEDIVVNFSAYKQDIKINYTTKDPEAEISFENARYHNGVAVILFSKDGRALVPAQFLGTEKIRIVADETDNYLGTSKVIKLKGVVTKFPYKSKSHVYKLFKTTGNAILKKLHARKEKFRINFDMTDYNGKAKDIALTLGAYVRYHQSKNYPYLIDEWTTPTASYGKQTLVAGYKGHTYGTLSFNVSYKMSLKKEQAFTKTLKKGVKRIGADKGTDLEKTRKIYKWITKHVRTAYTDSGHVDTRYDSAYKTYKGKKGTDKGYSRLMKAMCNITGVNCIYVENGTRAWCMVKIGKKWFQCDPYWDAGRAKNNWLYFMQPYTKQWKKQRGDDEIYPGYYLYNNLDLATEYAQIPKK